MLSFVRHHESSVLPSRGSVDAAGLDLYACESTTVLSRSHKLVSTGIEVHLPEGTYGRVAPRSGLAYRHGIDVGAGVIDRDYSGQIGVILFNHSDTDFEVSVGDRVAQLIIERCATMECDIQELGEIDRSTERGQSGFGSTGR